METNTTSTTGQAEKDLAAAHEALAAVVRRIAHGNATEEELEAAERRVRFCEARLSGARQREVERVEQERLDALEALAQRTNERVKAAGVEKARRTAEQALDRYVAACLAHNEAIDEAVDELLSHGELPQGFAVSMGSDGHTPTLAGRAHPRLRPMVSVAGMAHEVLRRHIPHGYIDLERPY